MKSKRRIPSSIRQSRIASLRENIWFYSESNSANHSSDVEQKSVPNDRSSILYDEYKHFTPGTPDRKKEKKESSFVVDWQMSDVI